MGAFCDLVVLKRCFVVSGTLVVSTYAPCPDIRLVITPDLKKPSGSTLFLVDLSRGESRLGGSALAQCYGQIGSIVPDLDHPELLKLAFNATQKLIQGLNLFVHFLLY